MARADEFLNPESSDQRDNGSEVKHDGRDGNATDKIHFTNPWGDEEKMSRADFQNRVFSANPTAPATNISPVRTLQEIF